MSIESIHEAAGRGNAPSTEQFLASGSDIDVKDRYGRTPLHHAAYFGHYKIAELLIKKGADVNAMEAKSKITPLHWSAWRGHIEMAKLLISNGSDVKAKNKGGGHPLHEAAGAGYTNIAALLISKGAEVEAKDYFSQTALDCAIKHNRTETADLLRKHGGKTCEELKAEAK